MMKFIFVTLFISLSYQQTWVGTWLIGTCNQENAEICCCPPKFSTIYIPEDQDLVFPIQYLSPNQYSLLSNIEEDSCQETPPVISTSSSSRIVFNELETFNIEVEGEEEFSLLYQAEDQNLGGMYYPWVSISWPAQPNAEIGMCSFEMIKLSNEDADFAGCFRDKESCRKSCSSVCSIANWELVPFYCCREQQ